MAYMGRPGATAPLTTADIPDNSITGAKIVAGTIEASDVAADMATQAELDTVSTVASAALPKAGGAMTGAITTNSTFDGVDVAACNTTASAALPKAGGTMTGTTTLQDSHLKILTNSADADDSNVWFQKSRHATDGSHTIVQDNDDLGSIIWDGSDGDSFESAAKIIGRIDGSPSAGSDMPGSLEFQTSGEGSASPTTRMVINSSGKVGIGTTAPDDLLHIKSTQGISRIESTTADASTQLILETNTTSAEATASVIRAYNGASEIGRIAFKRGADAADGEIDFYTANDSLSHAMHIDQNGNVGIGTEAPTFPFHVKGAGTICRVESTNTFSGVNFKSTTTDHNFGYSLGLLYATGVHGVTPYGGNITTMYISDSHVMGTSTSLREAKANIGVVPINTDIVYDTEILSFNYRLTDDERNYTDEVDEFLSVGAIAEDVELLDPNFVYYDKDGNLKGIKYERYVPYLVKAIQELSAKVTALENA